MTRDEAVQKMSAALENPPPAAMTLAATSAWLYLNALEAIGLIKFEKPEERAVEAVAFARLENIMVEIHSRGAVECGRLSMYGAGCVIDGLRMAGFKIVRAT